MSAEHAAHWVSHELAHNLGLEHVASGLQNLMATSGNSELLTSEQVSAIFQSQTRNDAVAYIPYGGTGFPKLLSSQLPGDYDQSGTVDTVDYAIWRKALGTTNLTADSNGDRTVDHDDYRIWRANYGKRGLPASSSDLALELAIVPEPAAMTGLMVASAMLTLGRRIRRRSPI